MVHILNITLCFSTLSSVWQFFPTLLRATVRRQALCKDSNYWALLGLIRLPSLDMLAQEGMVVVGEEGGVAAFRYSTKDTGKQGCSVSTR